VDFYSIEAQLNMVTKNQKRERRKEHASEGAKSGRGGGGGGVKAVDSRLPVGMVAALDNSRVKKKGKLPAPPGDDGEGAARVSARTFQRAVVDAANSAGGGAPQKRGRGSNASDDSEKGKRPDLKETPPRTEEAPRSEVIPEAALTQVANTNWSDDDEEIVRIDDVSQSNSDTSDNMDSATDNDGDGDDDGDGDGFRIPSDESLLTVANRVKGQQDLLKQVCNSRTGQDRPINMVLTPREFKAQVLEIFEEAIERRLKAERERNGLIALEAAEAEKCRRSIVIFNLRRWQVNSQYYGQHHTWSDIISEDIHRLLCHRVTICDVGTFKTIAGDDTGARITFASVGQKLTFYRHLGWITQALDSPVKYVSFRDSFPVKYTQAVINMNREGMRIKQAGQCTSFRVTAKGTTCEPHLEIKNGPGAWTLVRRANDEEIDMGAVVAAEKRRVAELERQRVAAAAFAAAAAAASGAAAPTGGPVGPPPGGPAAGGSGGGTRAKATAGSAAGRGGRGAAGIGGGRPAGGDAVGGWAGVVSDLTSPFVTQPTGAVPRVPQPMGVGVATVGASTAMGAATATGAASGAGQTGGRGHDLPPPGATDDEIMRFHQEQYLKFSNKVAGNALGNEMMAGFPPLGGNK
jgi:hypothetical protein